MNTGVFETMGLVEGRLPLWSKHIARLQQSVYSLSGSELTIPEDLQDRVLQSLTQAERDIARISCTWDAALPSAVEFNMTTRMRRTATVLRLAPVQMTPPASQDFSHKLTDRRYFEACLAEAQGRGCDDALVLGPDEKVRETTMCNLIYRCRSRYLTPAGSMLPGIARALLCERLGVEVAVTTLDDLRQADAIWVTNAVYGPRPAYLEGQSPPSIRDPLPSIWSEILAALPG